MVTSPLKSTKSSGVAAPKPPSTRKAAPPAQPAPAAPVKGAGRARMKAPVAAPPAAATKAVAPVSASTSKTAVAPKPVKVRLVRDSFTMPEDDHALIGTLKKRLLVLQRPTKKSELLRAGLKVLATLTDVELKAGVEGLAPIKTGRPKKH